MSLPVFYATQDSLNDFMRLGREEWRQVREAVTDILREDNPTLRDSASLRKQVLIPMVRRTAPSVRLLRLGYFTGRSDLSILAL